MQEEVSRMTVWETVRGEGVHVKGDCVEDVMGEGGGAWEEV